MAEQSKVNPFEFQDAERDALLTYFLDQLEQAQSSAGCNDMDQAAFAGLDDDAKNRLYDGFLAWDRLANPEDWEPRRFQGISDSSWLAYLRERIQA